jgi:hypothetical protein
MRTMIFNKLQLSILNGIVARPMIRLRTYCATPSQVTIIQLENSTSKGIHKTHSQVASSSCRSSWKQEAL